MKWSVLFLRFVTGLLVLSFLSACGAGTSDDVPLHSLRIEPTNFTFEQGETVLLNAYGVYKDGSEQNVSSKVAWISSNETLLTVTSTGKAEAKAVGRVQVTASHEGVKASTLVSIKPSVDGDA